MREKNKILKGTIKRHPDGFGFFIPQDIEHPDVFIPASSMKTAMTNDHVTVMAEKERDGRFKGEIIRIDERSQTRIAGAFAILNEKIGMIKDEGKGWGKDLKIPLEKSLSAKSGELVVAQIKTYPDEGEFTGEITEIIGDVEDALNDIKRVAVGLNIPEEFSPQTLEEAKKFKDNPSEADFARRKDLRELNLITIDGATAKDFDDAVFVEMSQHGFHLIVAIADVSHYVKPETSMDKDAYDRGTSVYFPNFVIPMLPEALSNGLCSLNPHVPRLALVADMHFSFTGEMTSSNFYEAVIESKARVTYGQAQEIIDQPEGQSETHQKFKHVQENILRCADLAKLLMARRFKEGSLDLEVPETELIIDGAGEPIDVIKSERLFAHRLIEEMMLAANVAVATELFKKEIPALYRTHEPPDPLKMLVLEKYLNQFGSKVSLSGERLQKKLTKALKEFDNDVQAQIIHILTLRSMSQAKYTLENIGHFGLGFDFYTHFTSPIRRYPDLIVHRLLKNTIGVSGYRVMAEDDVQTAGTWLSACEQRSAKAERQIQSIKKARFMKKMVGQEFEGMISSVTKFGVFVLLREFNTDGLIHLDSLGGKGRWEYDEESLKLVAPRSGYSLSIGDSVKILVDSVDIEQGQVNFKLVQEAQLKMEADLKTKKETGKDKRFKENSQRSSSKSKFFDSKKDKKKTQKNAVAPKSLKLKTLERHASENKKVFVNEPEHDIALSYEVKPKYSSLSDYLDKMANKKQKGSSNNETSSNNASDKSSEKKSGSQFFENRKNSEKRQSPKGHSGRVRKTRSKKSR